MTGAARQVAQKALSVGRVTGDLILKAYLNHLLWFTIGAVAGAITAFGVLTPWIVS